MFTPKKMTSPWRSNDRSAQKIFRKIVTATILLTLLFACSEPDVDAVQDTAVKKRSKVHVNVGKKMQQMDLDKLKTFLEESDHKTSSESPVIVVFVDTLRADYAKDMAEFASRRERNDGWISFAEARSPATTTDYTYFSLFYAQAPFFRNSVVTQRWQLGSPFLQVLKKSGYKMFSYGTPWYGCFDADDYLYSNDYELQYSGAVSSQNNYGTKMTSLLDGCFSQKPDSPFRTSTIPKFVDKRPDGTYFAVPEETASSKKLSQKYEDETHKFEFQHQAYLDYYALNTLLDKIKSNGADKKAFYFLHLWSTHIGYAWPEYGIPDTTWKKFSSAEKFNKFEPAFHWDADKNKYLGTLPRDQRVKEDLIINAYKNSINYIDFILSRIVDELKRAGIYDNTMLVVMGDHGEKFFEGNLNAATGSVSAPQEGATHCCVPVHSNTAIPLYVKVPKKFAQKKLPPNNEFPLGRIIDIFPTILDVVGYNKIEKLEAFYSGRSIFSGHPPQCNVSVSRKADKGSDGRRIFNISKGNKSILFETDNNAESTTGMTIYRELEDRPHDKQLKEFYCEDGKPNLDNYLNDPGYRSCLEEIFGGSFKETVSCK